MKDELTHYPEDDQEDLEDLVELAIRIDDRLQARKSAKNRVGPGNFGKFKAGKTRYDKDGDVIMSTRRA